MEGREGGKGEMEGRREGWRVGERDGGWKVGERVEGRKEDEGRKKERR